jgi:hypothetical protein
MRASARKGPGRRSSTGPSTGNAASYSPAMSAP